MGLCCAVVVTLDQVEMERPHGFRLVVMDQDGGRVAEAQGGFQVSADDLHVGERQQVPLAIDMRAAGVEKHGAHDVIIYIDGNRAWGTTFYVLDASRTPAP